ncbi:MAG: mucin-associated surface protein [Microcella sp.]|uniref:mucin-associated surface protein n=1 Tax=Microcella sp. TaxID=1913979 RepID=UPI002727F6F4|nr:mucin-associated surface protein [Microcella sp.]MDO8337375.1 mucin-associated surface protein [Microcella sp.]
MTRRLISALGGGALLVGLLAGCAPTPSYDPTTAERLQQHVLAVSDSSAVGDWATTRTRLLELEASASTALARGEITQERFDAIMSALALVQADVDAAIAAAEQAAAEQAAAEQAAAEQAAAEQAAAEEAARQAEEKDDKGKPDDKGKDKDDDDDD